MKIVLGRNAYGKNAINLSKIIRHQTHHEFRQITVDVTLQGDFEPAHTVGDNANILPTDTQKNTVYALAKDHFTGSIEDFGCYLANYFLQNNMAISQATIHIVEHLYNRLSFNGEAHAHAFVGSGNEKRMTTVSQDRFQLKVTSGIKDLLILKTTDSAFKGYIKDSLTVLKETDDRILATNCEAEWLYNTINVDYDIMFAALRLKLIETFAFHKSLSVQQTLYAMGEAVLNHSNLVQEIALVMPNKHHIPFNLQQFGLENNNEVFIATDEPYGYISATITRE